MPIAVRTVGPALVCEMETGERHSDRRLACRHDPSTKAEDVPSSLARLSGRTTGLSRAPTRPARRGLQRAGIVAEWDFNPHPALG